MLHNLSKRIPALARGVRLIWIFQNRLAEVQFTYLRKDHKWLSDSEAKKEEKSIDSNDGSP